jgi:hypothetical protein
VNARTASKNIEVEVDKPLGLVLGQKPGGGVVITVSATTLSSLPCFFSFQLSLSLNDPPTMFQYRMWIIARYSAHKENT